MSSFVMKMKFTKVIGKAILKNKIQNSSSFSAKLPMAEFQRRCVPTHGMRAETPASKAFGAKCTSFLHVLILPAKGIKG